MTKLMIPFDVEIKATAKGATVQDIRRRLNAIADEPKSEAERQYLQQALERRVSNSV
jgi:hypothetical protein